MKKWPCCDQNRASSGGKFCQVGGCSPPDSPDPPNSPDMHTEARRHLKGWLTHQDAGDGGVDERGQKAAEKSTQAEARQIAASTGGHGANSTELNADRS